MSSEHALRIPPESVADPRWARLCARDATADGVFWYSVSTTGVYCRPACPSRRARPEHVTFHATLESARASGARACRRCNPEGCSVATQNAAVIERACRSIEAAETAPSLTELAAAADLSPAYFHRLFKATTGITPHAYAAANKAARLRGALDRGEAVTGAIFEAGYGSASRFYADAGGVLGMPPARYRSGGRHETIRFALGQSSLGAILVASSEAGVAAISLGDDPDRLVRQLQDRFVHATLVGGDAAYERLVAVVVGLVESPGTAVVLPLDIRGTAFQRKVWQALRDIPPGATQSYGAIAGRIGLPQAVRAVAGACAANPLAVAIPCHRVVRSDGVLSGYRWGIARKRALIAREAGAGGGAPPEERDAG